MAKLNPIFVSVVFTAADVDNKRAYEYPNYNNDIQASVPGSLILMDTKMQAFERFRNLQKFVTGLGCVYDTSVVNDTDTAATPPPAGALEWIIGFVSADTLLDALFARDPATAPVTSYPNPDWPQSDPEAYILTRLKIELDAVLSTEYSNQAFETWTEPTRSNTAPPNPTGYFYTVGMLSTARSDASNPVSIPAGTGATSVTISGPNPFI